MDITSITVTMADGATEDLCSKHGAQTMEDGATMDGIRGTTDGMMTGMVIEIMTATMAGATSVCS